MRKTVAAHGMFYLWLVAALLVDSQLISIVCIATANVWLATAFVLGRFPD